MNRKQLRSLLLQEGFLPLERVRGKHEQFELNGVIVVIPSSSKQLNIGLERLILLSIKKAKETKVSADFEPAFLYLLENEGEVLTNDPTDHGGSTKFGITQRQWSHVIQPDNPIQSVADLTKTEAHWFYLTQVWNRYRIDELYQEPIATAILDVTVNMGPARCGRFAQKALKYPTDKIDGIIGTGTIADLNACSTKEWIIGFSTSVQGHYLDLVAKQTSQQKFLKGWMARAQRLLTLA